MGKKVTELVSNPMQKKADDAHCPICHPRDDRVPHDRVWRFTRKTRQPGLKDGVRA